MNLKASAAPLPDFASSNWLRVLVWIGAATSTLLLSGVAQASSVASDQALPYAPPAAADSSPDPLPPEALPVQPPLQFQAAASPDDLPSTELDSGLTRVADDAAASTSPDPAPEANSPRVAETSEAPVFARVVPLVNSVAAEVSAVDADIPADSNLPAAQETPAPIAPVLETELMSDQALPYALQPAQNPAEVAQAESPRPTADAPDLPASQRASDLIGRPLIHVQGAYLLQGDSSARGRVTGLYIVNPNLLFGATVDLTGGNAFSDSRQEGLNLNELYVAVSPSGVPGLRFVAGLMDLTSYFDRNSFAKDALTHFFNPVFQTNPALAASGISSRLGVLANWSVNDNIELKAATFSSSRNLDEFALDAFAGEIGLRLGNAIIRGTYVSDRDAGQDDGFREIYQLPRSNGNGLSRDDRESAYGINAEYFIPQLRLGLFGRYGWYNNSTIDRSASTYSVGFNFLDLFLRDDRLGLGYGRQLSNDSLRRADGSRVPDVLEFFYDVRLTPNLRAGVTLQERNEFSETIVGFRIRADFDVTGPGRRI